MQSVIDCQLVQGCSDLSRRLQDLPVPYAIGINCTKVHKLRDLIRRFEIGAEQSGLRLPRLVIYPDGASGLVYNTSTQQWLADTNAEGDRTSTLRREWHEEVGEIVRDVRERNLWQGILAGGCCKTTPSHIAELRKVLT